MKSNTTKKQKVGVALSGGAALGIAHVGALQSLVDHNISIDCISGTSAGAVVAACFAFNIPLENILERSKNLSWYKMSKITFSKRGFISHASLRKIFQEFFGDVHIEQAKIPLAIVATDIETAQRVVFTKGLLIDALLASTCIPGVFTPIEIEGRLLVDGGVIENFPISVLDDMGAQVKIGVNVNRWISQKKPRTFFDVISKSLEIMNAYKHPRRENELFIEPHLEDFSVSDFKRADKMSADGYRAATLVIPQIRDLLAQKSKSSLIDQLARWLRM